MNDRYPRAITPEGNLKSEKDWQVGRVLIRRGASLGAGVMVLPDIVVGEFAMVGAGTLVTHSVASHGLVIGQPGHQIGIACWCGRPMEQQDQAWKCSFCGRTYQSIEGAS
jgi:acetyltransferase-like isoleucine patch superfamily enzyme